MLIHITTALVLPAKNLGKKYVLIHIKPNLQKCYHYNATWLLPLFNNLCLVFNVGWSQMKKRMQFGKKIKRTLNSARWPQPFQHEIVWLKIFGSDLSMISNPQIFWKGTMGECHFLSIEKTVIKYTKLDTPDFCWFHIKICRTKKKETKRKDPKFLTFHSLLRVNANALYHEFFNFRSLAWRPFLKKRH